MTVVEKQRSVRAVVIHIEGPLRVPMIGHVRHKVAALLRRGERKILLNLAQVSDLDAAGVGELVRAYNMTVAANGVLRVVDPTARVRQLLHTVGLLQLLSAESALDVEDVVTSGRDVPGSQSRRRDFPDE